LHVATYRYQWKKAKRAQFLWGSWKIRVISDGAVWPESSSTPDSSNALKAAQISESTQSQIRRSLSMLALQATMTVLDTVEQHGQEFDELVGSAFDVGEARFIDDLQHLTGFEGDSAEFIEAATTILNGQSSDYPVIEQQSIAAIEGQLSNFVAAPR